MTDTSSIYTEVVRNDGDPTAPSLSAVWEVIRGLLAQRACSLDELIEATGARRNTVKGLVYYGRKAGRVREVTSPRREEAAPNVTLVRNVRTYRLTDKEGTP